MNVDQIFEKYTIKEIKSQHIESRSEIETKKEELRFLVSERYRDIIDAADNIFNMKTYTEKISDSIKKMNNIHNRWDYLQKKPYDSDDDKVLQRESLTNKTHLAAQIKLMFNMSDLIWNSLEACEFVNAALLFCVCRNISIHSKLVTEKYQFDEVDAQLILSRQWGSLSNFEATIWQICRRYLRSRNVQKEFNKILECLIAIMLVKGGSMVDMLDEYLESNKSIVDEWFSPGNSSTIRTDRQLIGVLETVVDTIQIVHKLFVDETFLSQLKCLADVTVKKMDCTKDERIYRFLPEQIGLFKPVHQIYENNQVAISEDVVAGKLENWLTEIRLENLSNFESSFSHLLTIKSAHDTCMELRSILSNCQISFQQSNEENEAKTKQISDKNTNAWLELVNRVFINKLKIIISEHLESYFNDWKMSIENFLLDSTTSFNAGEFDNDNFLEFLWFNSQKDIQINSELQLPALSLSMNDNIQESIFIFNALNQHLSNYLNIGSSYSGKNSNFEPLLVKIKGIRPEIFQATKTLNDQILEIVLKITNTVSDNTQLIWQLLVDSVVLIIKSAKDWCADKIVAPKTSAQAISPPADCLSLYKTALKTARPSFSQASNNPDASNPNEKYYNNQLTNLILAQTLRSICEFTPALQCCVMAKTYMDKVIENSETTGNTSGGQADGGGNIKKRHKLWRLPFLPNKRVQQIPDLEGGMWKNWVTIIEPLQKSATEYINASFCTEFIEELVEKYIRAFRYAETNPDHCNHIVTKWDTVIVQSTTSPDNNQSVPPVSLKLPAQASWPLHNLLLQLCTCLANSTGCGYTLPRNCQVAVRQNLLLNIIKQIKKQYQDSENTGFSHQLVAIQLIFDLRFLLEVTGWVTLTNNQSDLDEDLKSVLSNLELVIDPFDYSMMQDNLQNNLSHSISRCYSLYSILYSSNNPGSSSRSRIIPSSHSLNEAGIHNLLELANTTNSANNNLRFGLLPIVSTSIHTKYANQDDESSQTAYQNSGQPKYQNSESEFSTHKPASLDNSPKSQHKRPQSTGLKASSQSPQLTGPNKIKSGRRASNYTLMGRLGSKWF